MDFLLNIFHSFGFESIFRLVLGGILAGIIGLERSSWSKPAGFRTHALVGISSLLVMLCGEYMFNIYNMDPSRIPAQLLSGIGFIGAGTILRDGFNVKGLTTAAGLLAVTCIGLSIGAGFYVGGIVATIIVYIILSYSYKFTDTLDHFNLLDLQITTTGNQEKVLSNIENILSNYSIDIKQLKKSGDIENSSDVSTFKIIAQYNKKDLNKNELIKDISLVENVVEIQEN